MIFLELMFKSLRSNLKSSVIRVERRFVAHIYLQDRHYTPPLFLVMNASKDAQVTQHSWS